jgi:hypothetical protein
MMGSSRTARTSPRRIGDRMSSRQVTPGALGVGCAKASLGCVMVLLPLLIVGYFVIAAFTHTGQSSRPCHSSSCSSGNGSGGGSSGGGGGGSDGGSDGGDGGGDGGGGGD